ncbi:MAG: TorF family putative porin [Pseudomonadota bacterium]
MNKKAILFLTLPLFSNFSHAEEFEVSANVSLVSNYIFRGVSLSNDEPATQGGFDLSHSSGAYLGVWGSSDSGNGEIDFYGGYAFSVSDDFSVDVGVLRYYYPGVGEHTTEYHIGLSYLDFGFTYYYDETLESHYYELGYSYELIDKVSLDLHYGTFSPDEGDDVYDYSLSVSYAFNDSYSVFVGYSDHEEDSEYADGEVFAGISASF